MANTVTASRFAKGSFGVLDLTEPTSVVNEKVARIKGGDTSDLEATLTSQAVTLDAVFHELARRAALNMGEHLAATESNMRLAFKAQAQCRSTLETANEIKYPKQATFVRQQNIAGQQQVNNGTDNGTSTRMGAHAHGKPSNQPNELFEAQHGERMDAGATGKTGGADLHLEAVGKIDRR